MSNDLSKISGSLTFIWFKFNFEISFYWK